MKNIEYFIVELNLLEEILEKLDVIYSFNYYKNFRKCYKEMNDNIFCV